MRIRRGFLFWGLFLIPLGGIPLLVRAGVLPADVFSDAWRWWPIILIGIGIALLLGRSGAGVIGTALVALVLGAAGGAALASSNDWIGNITACAGPGSQSAQVSRDGTFSDHATTTIDLDCGTIDLNVQPGSGWRVDADYLGAEPRIDSSASSLTVRTPEGSGLHRQDWVITLGAAATHDIDIEMNAGSGSATLAGAAVEDLSADMNAGDLLIDGSGATIDGIDATVNAGRLRVTLDSGTSGELSVNAGAIELCVPPDANLQFDVQDQFTFATNLDARGLTQNGDTWTRTGTGATIALSVEGNAASFTLDPDGGCR